MRNTIAAAALLSWAAGCSPSNDASTNSGNPATPARESAALSEIQRTLSRIERRLDALELTSPEPRLPAAEPPDSGALLQLTAEVRALRAALEEHTEEERAAARGESVLSGLKKEYPESNWVALNELIHAWNVDQEKARRDLLLLGYRDVMEEYGSPTTTWGAKAGGLHWLYHDTQDPLTGETRTEVWIHFVDGFVVDMGIKQP